MRVISLDPGPPSSPCREGVLMMKRIALLLALAALCSVGSNATAGDNHQNKNSDRNHQDSNRKENSGRYQSQKKKSKFWGQRPPSWQIIEDLIDDRHDSHHHDHDHHGHGGRPRPWPIDPGMGNGQPHADPTPDTVPVRPGYIWVGDHWERVRAPQNSTRPTRPGYVWVGDHWERVRAPQTSVRPTKPGYVWVGDHWERVRANPSKSK